MNSYKCEWQKYLKQKRPEYVEVLRDFPEFENWDKDCYPDIGCSYELELALEILYADPDCAMGTTFLQHNINIAERVLREDKVHSDKCISSFPRNEGVILHTYAYAQFFKAGALETDLLVRAADDYVQWFIDTPSFENKAYFEFHILAAARLQIIAGKLDLAKETLRMKTKFRWNLEECKLLKAFIAGKIDDTVRASFDTYFDVIRAPQSIHRFEHYYDEDIARVDLALIAAKFLDQDAWPPNPRKILERISA